LGDCRLRCQRRKPEEKETQPHHHVRHHRFGAPMQRAQATHFYGIVVTAAISVPFTRPAQETIRPEKTLPVRPFARPGPVSHRGGGPSE
jgi:hypothetical protein